MSKKAVGNIGGLLGDVVAGYRDRDNQRCVAALVDIIDLVFIAEDIIDKSGLVMIQDKCIQQFLGMLARGCPDCDRDEAEGDLVDHCNDCCRQITGLAWNFFVEQLRGIGPVRMRTLGEQL